MKMEKPPFGAELVHDLLEALDVLDLVDEEVLHAPNLERQLYQRLELAGRLHRAEAVPVEVEVDDVVLSGPRLLELPGDGLHKTRLAAPADSGENFDRAVVVVEPADLLEVVHALEQTHPGPNLSSEASITNIEFIGLFLANIAIYTPITKEFSTPTRWRRFCRPATSVAPSFRCRLEPSAAR